MKAIKLNIPIYISIWLCCLFCVPAYAQECTESNLRIAEESYENRGDFQGVLDLLLSSDSASFDISRVCQNITNRSLRAEAYRLIALSFLFREQPGDYANYERASEALVKTDLRFKVPDEDDDIFKDRVALLKKEFRSSRRKKRLTIVGVSGAVLGAGLFIWQPWSPTPRTTLPTPPTDPTSSN